MPKLISTTPGTSNASDSRRNRVNSGAKDSQLGFLVLAAGLRHTADQCAEDLDIT